MTLTELKTLKSELDAKLKEGAKNAIGEEFKAFFEKHPEIKSVKWQQYTPHFDDGDPCVFGVREPDESDDIELVSGETAPEYRSSAKLDGGPAYAAFTEKIRPAFADLRFVNAMDEAYEAAFGDGVEVIATREGFEVNEYDHD